MIRLTLIRGGKFGGYLWQNKQLEIYKIVLKLPFGIVLIDPTLCAGSTEVMIIAQGLRVYLQPSSLMVRMVICQS